MSKLEVMFSDIRHYGLHHLLYISVFALYALVDFIIYNTCMSLPLLVYDSLDFIFHEMFLCLLDMAAGTEKVDVPGGDIWWQ